MSDTPVYLTLVAVGALALTLPGLVWALTRAWYLGSLEDRDIQLARRERDLEAAGAVIDAAEQAGFVQVDRPRGKHERGGQR